MHQGGSGPAVDAPWLIQERTLVERQSFALSFESQDPFMQFVKKPAVLDAAAC